MKKQCAKCGFLMKPRTGGFSIVGYECPRCGYRVLLEVEKPVEKKAEPKSKASKKKEDPTE